MRLPVVTNISTKDGASNKNARLTNMLRETTKTASKAVVRPGLVLDAIASGVGNGLAVFNDKLVSVYGSTLGVSQGIRSVGEWVITAPFASGFAATAICFFNGKYIVAGTTATNESVILTSDDGAYWTTRYSVSIPSSTQYVIPSLAASDSVVVGMYFTGSGPFDLYSITSPDGITWTPHLVESGTAGALGVLYDGSYFIASTTNNLIESTNGATWVGNGDFPLGAVSGFGAHAVLSNKIVASFQDDASGDILLWVSTDRGVGWTQSVITIPDTVAVVAGDSFFVAVAYDTGQFTISKSADGITFTSSATITADGSFGYSLAYFDGVFCLYTTKSLAPGDVCKYFTSEDAVTWTEFDQTETNPEFGLRRIAASDAGFFGAVDQYVGIVQIVDQVSTVSTVTGSKFDFAQSPI